MNRAKPQRLGQLVAKQHDRRLVRRKSKVEKHVAAGRCDLSVRSLHRCSPIAL